MSTIQIFEYDDRYRSSCIHLLKNTFPGESDEETFKWRFESAEAGKPLIICAGDGDAVVSFNSWIEWKFALNDIIYSGYQSGESATEPTYRGRGILARILKHADELAVDRGIEFLFGFPSDMIYRTFYGAGYIPIGILKYRLRFINPVGKTEENVEASDIREYCFEHLMDRKKVSPVIDPDYLVWRYRKNTKKYDLVKYSENNNVAVFILRRARYVNKRYNVSCNEVLLLDCMFSTFNDLFISNAFRHVDSVYRRKAVWIKAFFSENCDRGRALSPHFHVILGSRYETLCVKAIRKKLNNSQLFNHNHWDVTPHILDCF